MVDSHIFRKKANYGIFGASVALGFAAAVWTTSLQAGFFKTIGVSPWGALTVEPLLIVASFLLGKGITRVHRIVSAGFILVLLCVSFSTICSMYTKSTYVALDSRQTHAEIERNSIEAEKTIRRSLDSLTDRQLSGKRTLQMIDRLQKQERRTEAQATEAAATSDIGAVADTISRLMGIGNRSAVFVFALLASLAATFASSYLFFSAGMMIGASRQRADILPSVSESDTSMSPPDTLSAFLAECCVEGPGLRASPLTLYAAYRTWAERTGGPALSQKRFLDALTRRGFVRRRDHGGRFYDGISVTDAAQRDGRNGRSRRGSVTASPSTARRVR